MKEFFKRRIGMASLLFCFCLSVYAIDNPIVIGNSRITFITDNLVRLEYANHAKFLNDSTLFAVDHSRRNVDVNVESEGRKYIFTTKAMRLEVDADGCPFGQNNVKASWRQCGEQREWHMTDTQTRNLWGPVVTLDAVGRPIPRMEGLLSRDGWYLINDSGKDVYKNGWLQYRDRDHVQDLYLFVYGTDYKAALRSLAAISGKVPMTRKHVHGSWYCRWWAYTADDYREIVKGYKDHDFPMDVLVFDMDWHRKDGKIGTGHAFTRGWTGYSWNKELIPDPAALLKELKDQHIYVTVNDHPHDGIRPHEDMYADFIKDLGVDTTQIGMPFFDAGDQKYMKAFFKHAHGESEAMGVDFWWQDWQQDYAFPIVRGTTTKHVPWLNELYYNNSQKNNRRGMGFARWGGWGDHRHPIQFSGDAVGNWEMLRFEVDLTTSSGNAGCFFWAHDIGGFYDGLDKELYTRWTQFGLLNSSLRIHSVVGDKMDRRPWLWGDRQEKAMRTIYHLRSQLMPYIYSSVRQCHAEMLPLNRGLYLERPETEESYKHPEEFLFGDLILGAPVTEAGKGPDFVVDKQVYFPEGNSWYSLFTGKKYEGGSKQIVSTPLEESPVFIKGGWPLPMQPYTERMASTPLTTLIVRCYPGEEGCNNTYSLYEDDGQSMDYSRGRFATTALTYQKADGMTTLTIAPAQGEYEGQPGKRAYRIELPGVAAGTRVKVNRRKVKTCYDENLDGLVVNIKATDIHKQTVVTIG
mgnify:CR=1 FL=1